MLPELKEVNKYIYKKLELQSKNQSIEEIRKYGEENNIPIITKEVVNFIEVLTLMKKPKKILEIGSAIGYSGIIIGNAAKTYGGKLVSYEIDETRYKLAIENKEKLQLENIEFILEDALIALDKIEDEYDMIFIDASKGKYREFLKKLYDKLSKNGIVIIDNMLFRGYLYNEYPKRYKNIVTHLDKFIDELYKNYNFTLLSVGDGIGIVHKEKKI